MSRVLERKGIIRSNTSCTDTLWVMEIEVEDIGTRVLPGQFVHIQLPGMDDHILRRPFSVYYTKYNGSVIALLYQVVGFGSAHMTTLVQGTSLSVMGPIGQGWSIPKGTTHALLVAGGVGGAPLYLHAEELLCAGVSVDVIMGAQSASALVCEPRYTTLLGCEPQIATDDGFRGYKGFCTDLVSLAVKETTYDYLACCGPEPMMRIVCEIGLQAKIPTYVSLEKRMACGIGACLSCIVETKQGRKRSCIDGPVFDAAEVMW